MQFKKGRLLFSPSDLISFMTSPYASGMERLRVMDRDRYTPLMDEEDPLLKSLQQKGLAHENSFTDTLIAQGRDVLETKRASNEQMAHQTIENMRAGSEIITQGYLVNGQFAGLSDYLAKVPGPSKLGDYHYEVWDTKLSKKLKPYYVIQLCCYAEMLQEIQEVRPNHITIVTGDNQKHRLWTDHYFAYYRSLKKAFLAFHNNFDQNSDKPPSPAQSREFGRWSTLASQQLEQIDHLSQIANLRHQQINNLESVGITTMQQLANSPSIKVPNMAEATFQKAQKQSALQIASRGLAVPVYEILPHEPGNAQGLALLPPHNDMDVFFDIEGDPGTEGGLEYLWGNTYFDEQSKRRFKDFWAHDHNQEKQIFIEFIDWIYKRWLKDPFMHVYHYAPYEITAIRKLMGRYGVREEQVDNLLRNNVFVDLYKVVRHGLMIGEPRYSIKNVEHIYRGKRDTDVASGGESIVVYEAWRENPDGETWQTSKVLKSIRDYNMDDCDSTQELTVWLREEQKKHSIAFVDLDSKGEQEITEEITKTTHLRDELLAMADEPSDIERAKLLEVLAWSLEFHRRENKPVWWRFFDRLGLSELELYDDMDCLAGLTRTGTMPFLPTKRARNKVYEYRYDINQPFRGQARNYYVLDEGDMKVTCFDHQPEAGLICFQYKEELPRRLNVLPDEYVRPSPIPQAIRAVVEHLLDTNMASCAITDFLSRSRPRIKANDRGVIISPDGDFLAQVITASINLDDSCLSIQGPPGAGKTYTAKHIIGELLKHGKRVGISSNSHKAILNLMAGVAAHVKEHDINARLVKAGGNDEDPALLNNKIDWVKSAAVFKPEGPVCFGGTAWAFCNEGLEGAFDYLFIDEAGQVSVANLVGMSRATENIILMGDQMQLGQPIQGSHPGESGQSILEYLLQDKATIPDDIGIFLPRTYRMHPDVCSLISSQVYEGKLTSDAITKKYQVQTSGPLILQKYGICFVPVEHEGNAQASDEEVEVITALAGEFLGAPIWPGDSGKSRKIGWNDILFVAPYNYQVNKLKAALDDQARVGSVDKFQGQEAPIVILSMCSSDASESPRGIPFLFSKNRLNVAISRAQALAIVVGNPGLANTRVSTVEQMEQVNFFCKIVEEGERNGHG